MTHYFGVHSTREFTERVNRQNLVLLVYRVYKRAIIRNPLENEHIHSSSGAIDESLAIGHRFREPFEVHRIDVASESSGGSVRIVFVAFFGFSKEILHVEVSDATENVHPTENSKQNTSSNFDEQTSVCRTKKHESERFDDKCRFVEQTLVKRNELRDRDVCSV